MKKILFSVVVMAMLWSCGKDDSPTPSVDENSVPVITAKTFTVAETISDTEVIGKVTATDADDDALTFSIATNSDALFEITAAGDLSLASGKTLDAATKEQHAITVKVDDGEDTASATITIKVTSEEVTPTNEAPEMADQEFMAAEDITEANEIGQVVATDADGDALTFTMKENDNDLFAVSESGVLTLAEGKMLDYETATSHSITVSVTDGEETVDATITITVENVIESMAEDPASFVTTWKTEVDGEEIQIGVHFDYDYDFTIDWGDGTVEDVIDSGVTVFEHIYETAGTYTVAIEGKFPRVSMQYGGTPSSLMSIEQWGSIKWENFGNAFEYCDNMVYNATDVPDLSNVTNMGSMFEGATSFNGDISGWDTSNVVYMDSMFRDATSFNGDISGWDTSNVVYMDSMFRDAISFNGDISGWDTSNVTDMSEMFRGATSFNRDISGWDTSNVTDMSHMIRDATSFDQSLGGWDIGSVTTMWSMLNNSGMSKENVNATIIGWYNFVGDNSGPYGLSIGVDNLPACGPEVWNTILAFTNDYGWTFTGTLDYAAQCN
ncbi:BspA family leucine-rich repeat surface protein [Flagellimonas crocea]|uniref:BspA family leucine-rich repeat surface protein n=1 Tax=Flagellimonas crocea TaxID=3067311 RepID=UPI00296EF872|nr:BspA family leucine-rich repeat surface protein [Muricauda sp. DH64]